MLVAILAGCSARQSPNVAPRSIEAPPATATSATPEPALLALFTDRVSALKTRGGECATYASVLETSVRGGRVTVRPFMWRVGGRLVSGEARTDGAIVVARHIDSLNVGQRTVEDMMRTLEHEAAHVAFRIANGADAVTDQANDLVRSCR
jgi:hypothetical protein